MSSSCGGRRGRFTGEHSVGPHSRRVELTEDNDKTFGRSGKSSFDTTLFRFCYRSRTAGSFCIIYFHHILKCVIPCSRFSFVVVKVYISSLTSSHYKCLPVLSPEGGSVVSENSFRSCELWSIRLIRTFHDFLGQTCSWFSWDVVSDIQSGRFEISLVLDEK